MKRAQFAGRLVRLRELGLAAYLGRVMRRVAAEPGLRMAARADVRSASQARARGVDGIVAAGVGTSELRESVRGRLAAWVTPAQPAEIVAQVGDPVVARLIDEARRVLAGEVRVLGMEPVIVAVPRDWFLDPYSGHLWPSTAFGPRIKPSPFPGGPDIIIPWELSRGHDVLRLAQAYHLTSEPDFALGAVSTILSWVRCNPMPLGVNWVSSMEAAIRAVNWITALSLILDCVDDDTLDAVVLALWEHGCFIERHLEGIPGSGDSNNHLIACLTGLLAIATVLPGCDQAEGWASFAEDALEQELRIQVLPDGGDFESALGYHALVFGLLLPWWLACRVRQCGTPQFLEDILGRMACFLDACTGPDGLVPEVGDYDAGRLFRMRAWPDAPESLRDFRDTLGFAQAALGNVSTLYNHTHPDLALWLLGAAPEPCRAPDDLRMLRFEDSGIRVVRGGDTLLLIDAGGVGQGGKGGHSHDDDLSFSLVADGRALIVDPGTGTYTGDYLKRAWFRGPSSHNAPLPVGWCGHDSELTSAFGMDAGRPPVVEHEGVSEDGTVVIRARRHVHSPDGGAASTMENVREFTFNEPSGRLMVRDELISGPDTAVPVELRLVVIGTPSIQPDGSVVVTAGGRSFTMSMSPAVDTRIEDVDYSPAYGVIQPAPSVVFSWSYPELETTTLTIAWRTVPSRTDAEAEMAESERGDD